MTQENTPPTVEETPTENEGKLVDNEGKEVTVEEAAREPEVTIDYPEWLPEKFKSGDDWQEKLGKSYTELEKTLKEKGKAAPDEYELSDDIEIDTEDEVFSGFKDFAKKANLNNEQFNETLKFAKESGLLEATDYDEEMASLGKEKDTIIGGLTSYAQSKLSPDEAATLETMVFTADQARLLNKIIRSDSNNIPAKVGMPTAQKADLQSKLSTLMNDPEIRTNQLKKQEAQELAKAIAESK